MRIVCWQTILMKYHTLILSKTRKHVAKFVVCCSRDWRFKCVILYYSSLRAIRTLQKFGHLPSDASVFRSYAHHGVFQDIRVVAIEALVDFIKSKHHNTVNQKFSQDFYFRE